ncbi:MAG TPA: hypothetical protein VG520_05180 [Candidatus Dormibacteraeota bacterium]|nr:hypothetical protein [Candidatus Dormibacteraeota bacterium]
MRGAAETKAGLGDVEDEPGPSELPEQAGLSPNQAHEAAYRLLARYYEYERTAPIRRLLEAISLNGPAATTWAVSELWQGCVDETLDGAPIPELPPPWEP